MKRIHLYTLAWVATVLLTVALAHAQTVNPPIIPPGGPSNPIPPMYSVQNNAALQALLPAFLPSGSLAYRQGYNNAIDGGSGFYSYNASACSLNAGAGDGGYQIPANTSGCWALVTKPYISFGSWGPDPTFSVDISAKLLAFWKACLTAGGNGNICIVPQGHYKLSSSTFLDTNLNGGGGWSLQCAGQNSTLFDYTGTPGAFLKIASSANVGTFYGTIINCGVKATNAGGPAWQFGQDSLLDGLNQLIVIGGWAVNTDATSLASSAVRVNAVFFPDFTFTANGGCGPIAVAAGNTPYCPSTTAGTALELNASAGGNYKGSYSGATIGARYTNGYSYGNTFYNPDFEVDYYDVLDDSPFGGNNVAIGGQWIWDSGAGASAWVNNSTKPNKGNHVIDPNISSSPFTFFGGIEPTGVLVTSSSVGISGTPSFPASGIAGGFNQTGRKILAHVWGGNVSTYCYGPSIPATISITNGSATFTVTSTISPSTGQFITPNATYFAAGAKLSGSCTGAYPGPYTCTMSSAATGSTASGLSTRFGANICPQTVAGQEFDVQYEPGDEYVFTFTGSPNWTWQVQQ